MIPLPLAVHLSDGPVSWPWLAAGFAMALPMLWFASRRVGEDEIPRIGLITAVFFVGSLIHVRLGPASVHLILNGLAGAVLGTRAVLAIAVGLLLQYFLLQHGGYTTLGLNLCIIAAPALLVRPLIVRKLKSPALPSFRYRDGFLALAYILHPLLMLVVGFILLLCIVYGWRINVSRATRAGFWIGFWCVFASAVLNATVLVVGGIEDWRIVALLVLAAHVPIAVIEGFVTAFAMGYLQRVKPEMLS